jgi:hypothetical protein
LARPHSLGNLGKRGVHAPNWKGGLNLDGSGHARIYDVELQRYVRRSHLVWLEHHPGDTIPRGYVIHHRDGDKLNDVIENLEKLPLAEHVARHRRDLESYLRLLQGLLDEHGIAYPPLHGGDS